MHTTTPYSAKLFVCGYDRSRLNPKPCTLSPAPCILLPAPCTLHPKPCILCPTEPYFPYFPEMYAKPAESYRALAVDGRQTLEWSQIQEAARLEDDLLIGYIDK